MNADSGLDLRSQAPDDAAQTVETLLARKEEEGTIEATLAAASLDGRRQGLPGPHDAATLEMHTAVPPTPPPARPAAIGSEHPTLDSLPACDAATQATLDASDSRVEHPSIHDQREMNTLRDNGRSAPSRMKTISPDDTPTARYTRTKVHAQGGLGVVWSAVDRSVGREVALKELKLERGTDPRLWSRFLQEARITGQLEHPSIVPIYEVAQDPDTGRPYYTMRFIKGVTLADAVARYFSKTKAEGKDDPLAFRALLDAFVGVCQAVAYAHKRGVIHRDLKGQNVVLGDFGEAIVLDWGLAKVIGEPEPEHSAFVPLSEDDASGLQETREGQVSGTPMYMPPEQAEGRINDIDRRSDIYSLGAILYEIATGQPPYTGTSAIEILRAVKKGEFPAPRAVNPGVPKPLEAICLKALRSDRDARYQSATDLALEVQRFLADEPVEAYPEPWNVRAGRWVKKHKTGVAAAVVILTLSAAGLAAGNVLIARERDRVKAQREIARQAVDDMYTDVAEQWLEDRSDPLQQKFAEKALTALEKQGNDTDGLPPAPEPAPAADASERVDPTQRSFLERSLAYYDDFAAQKADGPGTALEIARARVRKANIERKLGKIAAAEASYRHAITELSALDGKSPSVQRALAQAKARSGAMQVTLGNFDQADPLLAEAESSLRKLAEGADALDGDRLEWGRTLREQAERLKLAGKTEEAEARYRESIAALSKLVEGGKSPGVEARHELALAQDALGVMLLLALDRQDEAARLLDSAMKLERGLVAENPTVPHLRAGLAKTGNTLGLILRGEGKSAEAVEAIDVSLTNYDRLAADFPGRTEYARALSRALINRGALDFEAGEVARAADRYGKSVDILTDLVKRNPEIAKHSRDLAGALNNLALMRAKQGNLDEAVALSTKAMDVDRGLVEKYGSVLEYRESLAIDERNLARSLAERAGGEDAQKAVALASKALATFETLAKENPAIAAFARGLAESQFELGSIHLIAGRAKEAEPLLRASLETFRNLAAKKAPTLSARRTAVKAMVNLAELAPNDAEALDREALAQVEAICKTPKAIDNDRFTLAVIHNNLGEIVLKGGKPEDAKALLARAAELFRQTGLGGNEPQRLHYLAYVNTNQGKIAEGENKLDDALAFYRQAVDSDREAAAKDPAFRGFLLEGYSQLGTALVKRGDHRGASDLAFEMIKTLPESTSSRAEATSLLARCMGLVRDDAKLPEPERKTLAKLYAAKGIAQLRQVIDSGYKRMDTLKARPEIQDLLKQPESRELLPDVTS